LGWGQFSGVSRWVICGTLSDRNKGWVSAGRVGRERPGQRVLLGHKVLGKSQGRAVEALDIQTEHGPYPKGPRHPGR